MENIGSVKKVFSEFKKIIVGQEHVIKQIMIGLLGGGHILLEGVPGVAKTLMAKTLARICALDFKRIQFTPDLMPSDILGTNVFDMSTKEFAFIKGPVFTDILLADEINRTPPKTQSALLEAMEEKRVSIEGKLYELTEDFFVIATQNPIEYEGTYPLPEAQIDRFMMKILVDYPDENEELNIYKMHNEVYNIFEEKKGEIGNPINREELKKLKNYIRKIKVEENIYEYVKLIIRETRASSRVALGASPRAGIYLIRSAKINAFLDERDYVIPDDIKTMALPILRHRLILDPETEMEEIRQDDVINEILSEIDIPR